MAIVNIEPTVGHPLPYRENDEPVPTLLEELAVAGNTAELQAALGATVDGDYDTLAEHARLLKEVVASKKPGALKQPMTALAAAAFLREYGSQLALDVAAARAAITNKLMEIANCGDTRYELKALELLGKHSDIGLFTERSEITINYKDPESLQSAIIERVKRLMYADVIDVTPLGADLDAELGPVATTLEEDFLPELDTPKNG
jgi:hypothetical protein